MGYDDEAIARVKAKYVAENGLGGIMFWSIDNDDFRGLCSGKPYPIIEAAKEALLDNLGFSDNDIAPPSKPTKSRSRTRPGSSSRNRVVAKDDEEEEVKPTSSRRKPNSSRRRPTTTPTTIQKPKKSSSLVVSRTTTPEPPTTPDPGADFKCEDEGFFPHPRDCKKYFWCLDSPNLGIVAHQFSCPSGLVFNKQSDSCDYARNVVCAKPKPIEVAKPTSAPPTTTTSSTSRPKITVATSKTTLFRTTTPSTTTEEPEYYDDDEDSGDAVSDLAKDIEDPRVIKELIDLIKKAGGIDELEKQLKFQENGDVTVSDPKFKEISTTPPTAFSKSLYQKVLSRTTNKLGAQNNRYSQLFNRKQDKSDDESNTEASPTPVVRQNSDSKYSSVIRNSRPNPQNAGLDELPEFDGFLKEKPKYVTIHRTRGTTETPASNEEDSDNDGDDEDAEEEVKRPLSSDRESQSYTTSQPNYVNIRRGRPPTEATSTTADNGEEEEVEEDDEEIVKPVTRRVQTNTPGPQYSSINRRRPTTTPSTTTATTEESVTEAVISAVTQNRYVMMFNYDFLLESGKKSGIFRKKHFDCNVIYTNR